MKDIHQWNLYHTGGEEVQKRSPFLITSGVQELYYGDKHCSSSTLCNTIHYRCSYIFIYIYHTNGGIRPFFVFYTASLLQSQVRPSEGRLSITLLRLRTFFLSMFGHINLEV